MWKNIFFLDTACSRPILYCTKSQSWVSECNFFFRCDHQHWPTCNCVLYGSELCWITSLATHSSTIATKMFLFRHVNNYVMIIFINISVVLLQSGSLSEEWTIRKKVFTFGDFTKSWLSRLLSFSTDVKNNSRRYSLGNFGKGIRELICILKHS